MKSKFRKDKTVIYPRLSFVINGILFQAHKKLGRFHNERQYCDFMEPLLKERNILYEREKFLPKSFEGEQERRNRVDFLIDNKIILEIKAKSFITKDDYYQLKRYLVSLNKKLGIIVNMRRYAITPKRVLNAEIPVNEEDYVT